MEHTFVIRTNDKDFKEAISTFLSKHCDKNKVTTDIYEMTQDSGEKVMQIVNEK
ncbi:hypothetical protein [Lysinibacillus sphaericus]|uniref:hypothetical protein n=1 Tax=Lysinibacillus sphaericus TaxID=1421 RepID=UPI000A8FFF86|nr:hypothetical protein [Lysinibacillus sphaericus]QPA61334.1 hypothetical protein INQ55_23680 [Lysinibacillus sphaericus]